MTDAISRPRARARFPAHGWLGLLLIAVFWPLNWGLEGLRTHWGFFPLWLGYCLTVDGLNDFRTGTSLLRRSWRAYIGLFLISAPIWWSFELVNWRTQNWLYLGREYFSDVEYLVLSSLSFSTVVPAVFGTAELFASTRFIRRLKAGPRLRSDLKTSRLLYAIGVAMFLLMMAWPRLFFPFIWTFMVFVLEPINAWLGNRTMLSWTDKGDWRPIAALWMGVLVCGFFWEMWNFFSYPKWVYSVPFFQFWHIFEMPFLGYFGYLPFAAELVAVFHLVMGLLGWKRTDYVMAGLSPPGHRSGFTRDSFEFLERN